MKQIYQLIHTSLVSCQSHHALRHRQFILRSCNFEAKVTAEFKENLLVDLVAISKVIVAQTDNKHEISMCINT